MKAKTIKDILKPKEDDLIISELLETDPENIPYVIELYDEIKHMENDDKTDNDFLYIEDLVNEYIEKIPDVRSSGLRGLKIALEGYKEGRMSYENTNWNVDSWISWVFSALANFKIKSKRNYKEYEFKY